MVYLVVKLTIFIRKSYTGEILLMRFETIIDNVYFCYRRCSMV